MGEIAREEREKELSGVDNHASPLEATVPIFAVLCFFPASFNYICLSQCASDKLTLHVMRDTPSNFQKTVAPVLKTLRNPPDTVTDYKAEYGYLGPQLQVAVVKARQAPPPTATTLTAPIRAITPTTTRIIQQGEAVG